MLFYIKRYSNLHEDVVFKALFYHLKPHSVDTGKHRKETPPEGVKKFSSDWSQIVLINVTHALRAL